MFLSRVFSYKNMNLCKQKNLQRILTKRYLKTSIFTVGKRSGGEKWIADGSSEYEKRLKPTMDITTTFVKSNDDLINKVDNQMKSKGIVYALDENGKEYSSIKFSKLVYDAFIEGGSSISFVIGGAEGLPSSLKSSLPLISLSKLTFTHTHARLILYEQIYRATEIHKGSKYHKA